VIDLAALFSFRTLLVTAAILGLFAAFAGSTFAQNPNGDTRPGWGFGDDNHEHTGPPGGPSVHPVK
jgi:hypothetical protein